MKNLDLAIERFVTARQAATAARFFALYDAYAARSRKPAVKRLDPVTVAGALALAAKGAARPAMAY